jgi:hypothetical protein
MRHTFFITLADSVGAKFGFLCIERLRVYRGMWPRETTARSGDIAGELDSSFQEKSRNFPSGGTGQGDAEAARFRVFDWQSAYALAIKPVSIGFNAQLRAIGGAT